MVFYECHGVNVKVAIVMKYMFKIVAAICSAVWLTACAPSLQEVENYKQRCIDLGGTPHVSEWKGTVQAVKCQKDGFSYYDF